MSKVLVSRLTTIDNPFDPFTQFEQWFAFDEQMGYHTCALLGRVSAPTLSLSEADYQEDTNNAIDEVLRHDYANVYKKVSKEIE